MAVIARGETLQDAAQGVLHYKQLGWPDFWPGLRRQVSIRRVFQVCDEARLLVTYHSLLLTITDGDFRTKLGRHVPAMNGHPSEAHGP
jgi:hypothetical protein